MKSNLRSVLAEWVRFIVLTIARLRRDIAIKVLPESLARDSDRLRRFEQEAQIVGAFLLAMVLFWVKT